MAAEGDSSLQVFFPAEPVITLGSDHPLNAGRRRLGVPEGHQSLLSGLVLLLLQCTEMNQAQAEQSLY